MTIEEKHLLLLLHVSRNNIEVDSVLRKGKRIITVTFKEKCANTTLSVMTLFSELYPDAEVIGK